MNFFGHAEVASWFSPEPAFVLGAMLPDFFSMLGATRPVVAGEELASGITLHHATDAAFHDIPEFMARVAEGRVALGSSGLGRGASRAAAHIGIELLLDEVLAADAIGRGAYFSALEHAVNAELPIAWTGDDGVRFRELMAVLAERGLPEGPAEPSRIARRLRLALASRPRLAFAISEETAVSEWVVQARQAVVGCSEVILTELRLRLLAAGFSSTALSDSPRG